MSTTTRQETFRVEARTSVHGTYDEVFAEAQRLAGVVDGEITEIADEHWNPAENFDGEQDCRVEIRFDLAATLDSVRQDAARAAAPIGEVTAIFDDNWDEL